MFVSIFTQSLALIVAIVIVGRILASVLKRLHQED